MLWCNSQKGAIQQELVIVWGREFHTSRCWEMSWLKQTSEEKSVSLQNRGYEMLEQLKVRLQQPEGSQWRDPTLIGAAVRVV